MVKLLITLGARAVFIVPSKVWLEPNLRLVSSDQLRIEKECSPKKRSRWSATNQGTGCSARRVRGHAVQWYVRIL